MITVNQRAFLDMIAHSELGPGLLAVSDNGYNVIVGSTPSHPDLFDDYSDHPRKFVAINTHLTSSAAGRYQQLARNYDFYKKSLRLPDFSPDSQDAIALQQIKECKALPDIESGNFTRAVSLCAHIWASLPGAGYGQHENKLADLQNAYLAAGGSLA